MEQIPKKRSKSPPPISQNNPQTQYEPKQHNNDIENQEDESESDEDEELLVNGVQQYKPFHYTMNR